MNQANSDNEAFVRWLQQELKSRGLYTQTVDGWAGVGTTNAAKRMLKLLPTVESKAAVVGSPSSSRALYDHAAKDVGLAEVKGPKSNPRIQLAIQLAAKWLNQDDSETSWCGCILGLWASELQLSAPAEYYRAANWLNVGVGLDLRQAVKGDIVILHRTGGNHVGLYDSHDGSHVKLLGGNQSNSVNLTRYPLTSLRGIRRI